MMYIPDILRTRAHEYSVAIREHMEIDFMLFGFGQKNQL